MHCVCTVYDIMHRAIFVGWVGGCGGGVGGPGGAEGGISMCTVWREREKREEIESRERSHT